MIRQVAVFDFQVADKPYRFECPPDAPIEHVQLVCNHLISFCVQEKTKADEVAKKQEEEKKVEELKQA